MPFVSTSLRLAKLAALLQLAGCASTGATFRSGVGDAYPEHPPYYAGAPLGAVTTDTSRIGHLPVAFQRGATQPAIFDPRDGRGTPVDALLEEMNGYLDSLAVSVRLVEGRRVSAVASQASAVPPDVRFGCIPDPSDADGECATRGDSALGRGRQQMQLAVGRPSREWTAWMQEVLDGTQSRRALVVTLEVGQYLMRQEGWAGGKVVELGTGHRTKLPWLTSLETPVTVLQLTGALVDRDGRAIRIGAEGFLAKRTGLVASALGAQALLSDEDVAAVRTQRREDLAGQPLAWKVAMRELVSRVTGRPVQ